MTEQACRKASMLQSQLADHVLQAPRWAYLRGKLCALRPYQACKLPCWHRHHLHMPSAWEHHELALAPACPAGSPAPSNT